MSIIIIHSHRNHNAPATHSICMAPPVEGGIRDEIVKICEKMGMQHPTRHNGQFPCQRRAVCIKHYSHVYIVNATPLLKGAGSARLVASDRTFKPIFGYIINFPLSNSIVRPCSAPCTKTTTLDGQQTGTVHPSFINILKYKFLIPR